MPSVDWFGQSFEVADEVSDFAMMEYADAVARGGEAEAASAIYGLLREVVAEKDWPRFRKLALKEKASVEQLGDVIAVAFGGAADRPTERPSDSSSGPRSTSAASTDDSLRRVVSREEGRGRPDRALMVLQASGRATA